MTAESEQKQCPPADGLFGWTAGPVEGRAVVFGVPSDTGNGAESGARHGPEAIRQASGKMDAASVDGVDLGDIDGLHESDWSDAIVRIQTFVDELSLRRGLPVMLGGDHSVSYAAIAALSAHQRVNIVWFDAHTDCCAWPGGSWHNHKQVLRRCASLPGIGTVLQVGHRGITYHDERRLLPNLQVVTAQQALTLDSQALVNLLPDNESVYISIDIDVIDPYSAPGTGHPVPGGMSAHAVATLAAAIARQRPVAGMDLTEVNPLLDVAEGTASIAAGILRQVLCSWAAAVAEKEIVRAIPVMPEVEH